MLEGEELKKLITTVNRLFNQLSPLTQAALHGDRSRLAQLFQAAGLQLDLSRLESPLQTGFFSRRLLSGAGGEGLDRDLAGLDAALRASGLTEKTVEVASRHLASALRQVEEAARREVQRQVRARLRRASQSLADRELYTLSRAELERTEAAVRKLAEKLKSRLVRKQRAHRRGALNVRRTLRKNLPWGGVPMVPRFRNRRPERPEVVVLCDVSDSVRNVSRLMLLFTYTLQALFARVRSFVFVSDVGEVTQHFREAEVEQAVDLALAGKAISLHANSNYGRALATFAREHLPSVTRRTTVLVIGDGRNNFNAPNAWALEELGRKCKRLVWICPEERRSWGFGDSEMLTYAKHCHQTVVVRTLADLSSVADQLVAT
jgi:uncharacterized protein